MGAMGGLSALAECLKTRADKPPMAPGAPVSGKSRLLFAVAHRFQYRDG